MKFVHWFLQDKAIKRNFTARVPLTGETNFSLEGVMTFRNILAWADKNLHDIRLP